MRGLKLNSWKRTSSATASVVDASPTATGTVALSSSRAVACDTRRVHVKWGAGRNMRGTKVREGWRWRR